MGSPPYIRRAGPDELPCPHPKEYDPIVSKLSTLQTIPRPSGSLKMHGSEGWRIRVGDYRIIYDVDDKEKIVIVRRVGHRREIYR